jgi:hypothetical protein
MREDEGAGQDPEGCRRHSEEVGSNGLGQVIPEKCPPGRGAGPPAPHVLGHRGFGDAMIRQTQSGLNLLRAPEGTLACDAADEVDDLARQRGSASSPGAGLPFLEEFEALAMPAHDSGGFGGNESRSPVFPSSRQENPEETVALAKPGSLGASSENH